jgi:hypothetical protein
MAKPKTGVLHRVFSQDSNLASVIENGKVDRPAHQIPVRKIFGIWFNDPEQFH